MKKKSTEDVSLSVCVHVTDGYEAKFENAKQIELVNHLIKSLDMWKAIATTHKKAIDLLYKGNFKD